MTGPEQTGSFEAGQQPHVIVDVGSGEHPWATDANRRSLGPNDEYIGVDLFPNLSDETLAGINRLQAQLGELTGGGSVRLERADAAHLPFEDESADEVIFTNVFGYALSVNQRAAMAAEAVRILRRPFGTITVVETYTPKEMPLDRLRELFNAHGFAQLNRAGEKKVENIRLYSDPRSDGSSYIATFFRLPPREDEASPTAAPVPPQGGDVAGGQSTVGSISGEVGNGIAILDETLPGAQDSLLRLGEAHRIMVGTLSGKAAEAAGVAAVAQAMAQLERYSDAVALAKQELTGYVSAIGGVLPPQ